MFRRLSLALVIAATLFAAPAAAADRKAVVIGPTGQQQQIQTGDTLSTPAIKATGITGSTQCVQADSAGLFSGTGSGCSGGTPNLTGSTGLVAQTGSTSYAARTLTAPAAGIGVTNGNGVAGNPTLALANDLASLEALSCTACIPYRSATDTWAAISLAARLSLTTGTLDVVSAPKWETARTLSFTGDVTGSNTVDGSGNVATALTIGAGKVTLAMQAAIADQRLLGNNTGGSASPVELTAAQVRTMLALVVGTNVEAWDADLDTLAAAGLPVSVANGGTGQSSYTNGQLLIGNTTGNTLAKATITAGTGISVTNGAGAITITNTGAASVGTEVLISEVVTSSSQATVSFTSIANTWRDLRIVVRGRGTVAANNTEVRVQYNADTASNYYTQLLDAQTSGTVAGVGLNETSVRIGLLPGANATANMSGLVEVTIGDYRGTVFEKASMGLTSTQWNTTTSGGGGQFFRATAGHWRSTAAITRADVFTGTGAFTDGTVVSLYGHF